MSDTILTEPIILDETGQLMLDKLDAIISALNPNAQGVSFDKTGCEIITANNVQGALTQLDSGLDDTNASLMKCQEVQFTITGTAITGVGQYATILNRFDLKTSTAVDSVFTNKQLKDIFGGHTIKGVVGLYTNGATIPKETIVWTDDETLTMSALSFVASTQTVTAVRLLVFYI